MFVFGRPAFFSTAEHNVSDTDEGYPYRTGRDGPIPSRSPTPRVASPYYLASKIHGISAPVRGAEAFWHVFGALMSTSR